MTDEEKLMLLGDDLDPIQYVLMDVSDETERQNEMWGDQSAHPDGSGGKWYRGQAELYRKLANAHEANGALTWADILLEEVFEALAEDDADKLRTELVQVAAVASQWIAALDKRGAL